MKNELSRLIEVDAIYGEISKETAASAKDDMHGAAVCLIISFVVAAGGLAAAVGCILASHIAIGSSFGVIGTFFFFSSRFFLKELRKSEDILLAYTQREKLRELRGDAFPSLLPDQRQKKLKR